MLSSASKSKVYGLYNNVYGTDPCMAPANKDLHSECAQSVLTLNYLWPRKVYDFYEV